MLNTIAGRAETLIIPASKCLFLEVCLCDYLTLLLLEFQAQFLFPQYIRIN